MANNVLSVRNENVVSGELTGGMTYFVETVVIHKQIL